jgi:hypothetical protein
VEATAPVRTRATTAARTMIFMTFSYPYELMGRFVWVSKI